MAATPDPTIGGNTVGGQANLAGFTQTSPADSNGVAVFNDAQGNVVLVNTKSNQVVSTGTASQDQANSSFGPGQAFKQLIPGTSLIPTPASADLGPSKQAQADAQGLFSSLGTERANYGGIFDPTASATNFSNQNAAIGLINDAANGRAPSAAQIMLQQQAANDANQAYGIAAAMPGRSPGATLRAVLAARAGMAGATDANAAALRANEMANARQQLVQGLQGQQQQYMGLRGQDIDYKNALLQGQVGALGADVNAANGYTNASATAAGAKNQFYGGLINTGARAFLPGSASAGA